MVWRKLVLSQVRERIGVQESLCGAERGMGGNQRMRWKWRGMSVSGYMPWSLDRVQDLGDKEKNSGLMGCVINALSWGWTKEEGVANKRLNSSKSMSVGNGAPLGRLSKEFFLKCMVFYFLCYGPWIWPWRRKSWEKWEVCWVEDDVLTSCFFMYDMCGFANTWKIFLVLPTGVLQSILQISLFLIFTFPSWPKPTVHAFRTSFITYYWTNSFFCLRH